MSLRARKWLLVALVVLVLSTIVWGVASALDVGAKSRPITIGFPEVVSKPDVPEDDGPTGGLT